MMRRSQQRRSLATLLACVVLTLGGILLTRENVRSTLFRPSRCGPLQNVFFLKTHKCASSTVMNIFLRYGVTHGLNFVLPKDRRSNYIAHPRLFNESFVDDIRVYNLTFNIFTHHTRFEKDRVAKIMPRDTAYVTIVRRPEHLFKSLFHYYQFPRFYNITLQQFLRNATAIQQFTYRRQDGVKKLGFNQMSFDMGLEPSRFHEDDSVSRFIDLIEKTFHLVMVVERMDESLVLLKDLLCWTTEDVVAFKINSNRRQSYMLPLSREDEGRLKRLNSVDVRLYERFSAIIDQKVAAFGVERMAREVEELRGLRRMFQDRCNRPTGVRNRTITTSADEAFTADTEDTCRFLNMGEIGFHKLVRRQQDATVRRTLRSLGAR